MEIFNFTLQKLRGMNGISKPITQWDYRWEFSGNGSINVELRDQQF